MKLPNAEFWDGKRVFLTGARGFKGRWLNIWLDKLGACVETSDTFNICDKDNIQNIIVKFQPEIVIHLAAVSTVHEAFIDPARAMETNAVGTTILLNILKDVKSVKAILNVTTDKVYHIEGIDRGYSELDPLGGLEMYSVSKVASEFISKVYQKTFKLPLATARAGNVIGGGDWKRTRIIPNYYFAQVEHRDLEVNKDAVRPWQYVLDCLCGYLLLCERLYDNDAYRGPWNFASNEYESRSVQWVVDEMNKYFENPVNYTLIDERGYYETKNLKMCSDKAHNVLQWHPKYDMKETVRRTAMWYNSFMHGELPDYLHEMEINEYMGWE